MFLNEKGDIGDRMVSSCIGRWDLSMFARFGCELWKVLGVKSVARAPCPGQMYVEGLGTGCYNEACFWIIDLSLEAPRGGGGRGRDGAKRREGEAPFQKNSKPPCLRSSLLSHWSAQRVEELNRIEPFNPTTAQASTSSFYSFQSGWSFFFFFLSTDKSMCPVRA